MFQATVMGSRKQSRSEKGQILILTAVTMTGILGIAGLAIDAAYMYDKRNRLYAAADAAAKTAAIEVRRVAATCNSQSTLHAFADPQVAAHGFNPGGTTTVDLYCPPVSGSYIGNSNFVEAVVSETTATFFGRVLGWMSGTPGARAVAGPGPGPDCLVVLKDIAGAPEALDIGNMTVNLPYCGLTVNGNLQTNPSTPSNAINAQTLGVHIGCLGPQCPQPREVDGVPAVADPLLGKYTAPTDPGGCQIVNDPVAPLPPGCYSKITTGSNKTITFAGGEYYIKGPVLIGNNNTITGSGVLLYFAGTQAAEVNCTAAAVAGCIDVANGVSVNLSAMTSGAYTALLMWQASTNRYNATFDGNNPIYNLSGAMYFPTANVSYRNGIGAVNDCMLYVAWSLKIDNGNGSFSNVCAGFGGSPLQTVSMAE